MTTHHDIALRNLLLVQLLVLMLIPGHAALVRQELLKLWKRIHEPLFLKKEAEKKKNRFWEIDMTKFEP